MHNEQDSFMEEMKSQQKCLFDDYYSQSLH